MSKILAGLALATLAGAASAQTITFSVVFSPVGPVGNNAVVNGTVRATWTGGASGATGLAGGQFRLRFGDTGGTFSVANITAPLGSASTQEPTTNQVGHSNPTDPLAPTPSTSWSIGRRPKTAVNELADPTDPSQGYSVQSGGGFRFPTLGSGPTDLAYRAENQGGIVYLTGRNGASVENRIEFAQVSRGLQADPLFYVSDNTFDLFKFRITTPASGAGVVSALPEIAIATLYTSDSGAQTNATLAGVAGTIAYSPSPSTLALLGLGGLVAGRRRRN
jgi:hypothetical protein